MKEKELLLACPKQDNYKFENQNRYQGSRPNDVFFFFFFLGLQNNQGWLMN